MKAYFLAAFLGISPGIFSQVTGGTTGDTVTWLTGGTVITIAGLFYKTLRDQISRLQLQVDNLTAAAERRAEEDRKLIIPLLGRSAEAQAAWIQRALVAEDKIV